MIVGVRFVIFRQFVFFGTLSGLLAAFYKMLTLRKLGFILDYYSRLIMLDEREKESSWLLSLASRSVFSALLKDLRDLRDLLDPDELWLLNLGGLSYDTLLEGFSVFRDRNFGLLSTALLL